MAIVWPCPLSVDAYVAAGRKVEVPRPDCPDCSAPTTRWSGYLRFVRDVGRCRAIFVPRPLRAVWDDARAAARVRRRRAA